jgi:gamma-aminobutyric acid receptor subunit beta
MHDDQKLPAIISVITFSAVLNLALGGISAGAETTAGQVCAAPSMKAGERPGDSSAPILVSVGLWLLDITEIDDVNQRVSADFLVYQSWVDSRLDGLAGCRLSLDQVWSPRLGFLNSGRVFSSFPDRVTIGDGGKLQYVQRYQGSLSFRHRLDTFPFDRHVLRISLVPVEYLEQEVKLAPDDATTGREPRFTLPDWSLQTPQSQIGSLPNPQTGVIASQYNFDIPAQRHPNYYVWKIIIPLVLIVAMSWTVFWINPAQFGPQIGMSATSMLTLIAFQFATTNILPRLNYFTVLDEFITGSTIVVFLALLEALSTSYLVSCQREQLAMKLDRVCRVVFPSVFLVMMLFVFR